MSGDMSSGSNPARYTDMIDRLEPDEETLAEVAATTEPSDELDTGQSSPETHVGTEGIIPYLYNFYK